MPVPGTFPSRGVWRRPGLRPVDLVVFAALLALLFGRLRLAPALNAPFLPKTAPAAVSPIRPACRTARPGRCCGCSSAGLVLVSTFAYATAAARLPVRRRS